MINGSCLCGGITYQVGPPFELMAHCHCTECRKASGADFATNATVDEANFELLTGKDLLGSYESAPGNHRKFCQRCGSPIMKKVDANPGKLRIRMGLLERDPGVRPALHVFVAERPAWSEIRDALPQFDGLPVPPKA